MVSQEGLCSMELAGYSTVTGLTPYSTKLILRFIRDDLSLVLLMPHPQTKEEIFFPLFT
jgi:hypothetical protein